MPQYIGSGLFSLNNSDYRFLMMEKYQYDLQTLLNKNNQKLNEDVVLYIGRNILFSLEYIHSKGFVHADIKGSNIMINNKNEVILIDYGLAFRFYRDGEYHEFHQNKKDKHNGTIEYTSQDAHIGCSKTT